jgi:hypothetical protein
MPRSSPTSGTFKSSPRPPEDELGSRSDKRDLEVYTALTGDCVNEALWKRV